MTGFSINPKWGVGLSLGLVIIIWHLAAITLNLPLILPTPLVTFDRVFAIVRVGQFWLHLGATLARGGKGFGISLLAGFGLGMIAGRYPSFKAIMQPLIVIIRSTPSMSLIILALIWFKGEVVPVFITFLVVFPIIVQTVIDGIQNFDRELWQVTQVYQVSPRITFLKFYLPSVAPFLAAGMSAGLGITWKVLIAAEVLSYPTWGIGVQMDTARVYLQTDQVFAWTLIVIGIGLCFDYLLDFLFRKPFSAWKGWRNV